MNSDDKLSRAVTPRCTNHLSSPVSPRQRPTSLPRSHRPGDRPTDRPTLRPPGRAELMALFQGVDGGRLAVRGRRRLGQRCRVRSIDIVHWAGQTRTDEICKARDSHCGTYVEIPPTLTPSPHPIRSQHHRPLPWRPEPKHWRINPKLIYDRCETPPLHRM